MSTHKHPASRAHLDNHRAAVRALERETSRHLDQLYTAARIVCMAHVDALLAQMQQEQRRLAQRTGQGSWDTSEDAEAERPLLALSWLDGPHGRLITLTAHIEQALYKFEQAAAGLITAAHEQVTAVGERAATDVLAARRSSDDDGVRPLPAGTLAALAGRAGNGQPVATLFAGIARTTTDDIAMELRVGVQHGAALPQLRYYVRHRLDVARHRTMTVAKTSLEAAANDVEMAVYRVNGVAHGGSRMGLDVG